MKPTAALNALGQVQTVVALPRSELKVGLCGIVKSAQGYSPGCCNRPVADSHGQTLARDRTSIIDYQPLFPMAEFHILTMYHATRV